MRPLPFTDNPSHIRAQLYFHCHNANNNNNILYRKSQIFRVTNISCDKFLC